ncbi:MAG: arginine--tRNA ligase [Puniceicoccales bacterium]|jgi:arginyl-tRNA synthetase|nr:arginine--tRNA ligase [Puniceicoccales bacterium]
MDWFNVLECLRKEVIDVASKIDEFQGFTDPEVRLAEAQFGDLQVNGVLPFAKKNGMNPKLLAEKLMDAFIRNDHRRYFAVEVSDPGFVNFRLTSNFFINWMSNNADASRITATSANLFKGKKIVIDYSSPNTAKQMHVGHLRSMIIGEAIQRMLRFCGADIIRDNHVGDWGTQFGILLAEMKAGKVDLSACSPEEVLDLLEEIYRSGNEKAKTDASFLEKARNELVKLQAGDKESLALWEQINKVSYKAFEDIYEEMNVGFDYVLGESFYRDKVDRVYAELEESGIAEYDDGALVVFHREHERFRKQPFIVKKSDGASNYATTDLATVLYRVETLDADELIYVTDSRQQDHFQQLFMTISKWFSHFDRKIPELRHVWFGTVLGENGKAIKTRSGEAVKLKQLLDEAKRRAYAVVSEKNPDLPEEEKKEVARVVGLGAVKYVDLSQNRTHDYIFSWDKMLSFDGNTAPYLLYAVARLRAIFRKIKNTSVLGNSDRPMTPLTTREEHFLCRKIVMFPVMLRQAIEDLRPHFLCNYLYELASEFSVFYNLNKIISEDSEDFIRRMMICSRVLDILEIGLGLLGLETLEKM